jgi:DNA-binding transcriptional regulator YiaG
MYALQASMSDHGSHIGLQNADMCANMAYAVAIRPTMTVRLLLTHARHALGMSQREFGYALGSSHRTATRWDAGQSSPADFELRRLVELLQPVNRDLAVECAAHLGETLVDLGLEAPPPPPPLPFTTNDLVDVVLCAAAEAADASPRSMRSVLHVAFRRARQMGLDVRQVEAALAPPPEAKGDAKGDKRGKPEG